MIAGGDARLDHGRAFPVLTPALVVVERKRHRYGDWVDDGSGRRRTSTRNT